MYTIVQPTDICTRLGSTGIVNIIIFRILTHLKIQT